MSTGDIISAQDRNQQNEDDLDEISLPDDISGDDSKTSRRIHVQLFPCKDDTHIDSMHPRSWSPEDNTQQLLLKTQHLGELYAYIDCLHNVTCYLRVAVARHIFE